MSDTTFSDYTTVVPASWLNDVNRQTYDLPDSTSPAKGDALVAVKSTRTSSVATTQHERNERTISVFEFLTAAQRADVVARTFALDLTVPLATAASVASTLITAGEYIELEFPSGGYGFATSPNWGISFLTLRGKGLVELKCTGSGPVVNMDGTAAFLYGIRMENFLLTGNASTTNIFTQIKVSQSIFRNIDAREGTGRAFDFRCTVDSVYENLKCSINAHPTMTNKPVRGIYLTSTAGLSATANTFINPIIEGMTNGIELNEADFNTFIGGTSESNTVRGVVVNTLSKGNTFINLACENNTTEDILEQGVNTTYQGGYYSKLINFSGATRPYLRKCRAQSITLDASTTGANIDEVDISSFAAAGVITNLGTENKIGRVYNANTLVYVDITVPTIASAATIFLPTSAEVVSISGGTNITTVGVVGHSGRRVTLIFQGVLTFTDGVSLKLAGNFVTTADDTITLVCDGTTWYEVSRSVN